MAVVTKRIEVHRRFGLSSTPTIQIAQVASLSAVKGAPVYVDSNGFIAPSTTETVGTCEMISTVSRIIVGFLQEDGAGSAQNTSKVGVTPAVPGVTFKGQLIDSTGDSAAGALATIAQNDLFTLVGLGYCASDTHYGVDKGVAGSRDCLMIVELIDPVGTVGGLVGFQVRDTWNMFRE
jgi:hypothetical protein